MIARKILFIATLSGILFLKAAGSSISFEQLDLKPKNTFPGYRTNPATRGQRPDKEMCSYDYLYIIAENQHQFNRIFYNKLPFGIDFSTEQIIVINLGLAKYEYTVSDICLFDQIDGGVDSCPQQAYKIKLTTMCTPRKTFSHKPIILRVPKWNGYFEIEWVFPKNTCDSLIEIL